MPLFGVNLPANVATFFRPLYEVASFDILPTDQFFEFIFPDFVQADPGALTDKLENIGYGDTFFLLNIGSFLVALLAVPLLVILDIFLRLLGLCWDFAHRMHLKLSRKLYWEFFLSILFESYSMIVISVMINTFKVSTDRL